MYLFKYSWNLLYELRMLMVKRVIPCGYVLQAIMTKPVLSHAKIGALFVIDGDSSQFTIAVLQPYFEDDGKQRLDPIAYMSKKLTQTDSRYPTQEPHCPHEL